MQLLNEFSTCWSELKKLAKILVGSDPDLFPLRSDQAQEFQDKSAAEIRLIAARLEKKNGKAELLYDPDHIRTSIMESLTQFKYLNYPVTTSVSISHILCNI